MIRRTIVALAVAALAVGCAGGAGTTTKPLSSSGASEEPVATTTKAAAYTPKPGDFKLTVKTLKKECFGSAGCNVTFRVQVAYGGEPLDPDTTWEITYEVRGGEDGPQVNTLTLQGKDYEVDREEFASTSSSGKRLTAVVTSVDSA